MALREKNFSFLTVFVSLLFFLVGCSKDIRIQGYNFSTAKPDAIVVGSATQHDVIDILGTPTSKSEVGPQQFFYISRKVENIAFFDAKVLEQEVLSINFDNTGVVSHISHYTLDDSNKIIFARELTEIKGNSLTPVQQILTNVGKYRKK